MRTGGLLVYAVRLDVFGIRLRRLKEEDDDHNNNDDDDIGRIPIAQQTSAYEA